MTVTRLPISWHHPVCAARRPGKAVLVASGPVAGLERLGRVARNRAGEVDVISTPGCSRSQASRASAVRARAAHQHVCASRRRSGSWRSSDAGAGRRSTPSTRGTRSAGNGRRSSTRTTVCRETSMASTASTRARRRRSARPAGACAADSVRARREAAHGRSAGRSPRCAPQAPDTRNDPYTSAIERDVGHDPLIMRVHPARFDAADRTGHGPAHPSVTSSMTSGDSQKTPCSQAGRHHAQLIVRHPDTPSPPKGRQSQFRPREDGKHGYG